MGRRYVALHDLVPREVMEGCRLIARPRRTTGQLPYNATVTTWLTLPSGYAVMREGSEKTPIILTLVAEPPVSSMISLRRAVRTDSSSCVPPPTRPQTSLSERCSRSTFRPSGVVSAIATPRRRGQFGVGAAGSFTWKVARGLGHVMKAESHASSVRLGSRRSAPNQTGRLAGFHHR